MSDGRRKHDRAKRRLTFECQPPDGQAGTRLRDSAGSVGSAAKAGRSARRPAAHTPCSSTLRRWRHDRRDT